MDSYIIYLQLTLTFYYNNNRVFQNSRSREKWHLPTTISCQKIEENNLLLFHN
jgi:hypothetical protein